MTKTAGLALCFALAACAAPAEAPDPAAPRQEPRYFLRVFSGSFAIPRRYEVASYGEGRMRLLSPTTLNMMSAARPNETDPVSSISITSKPCPDHSRDRTYRTVESERFGLSFALYNVIGADLETITERVEIGDGYQCMVILGDSRGFWRESLATYGRIAELMANP